MTVKKMTNREKALIALTLTGSELKAWRKKYPECRSLIGYYRHRPKNTRPRGRQVSEMKKWVQNEAEKACLAWLKMMCEKYSEGVIQKFIEEMSKKKNNKNCLEKNEGDC